MIIPDDVLEVVKTLQRNAWEAYLVGGSVRDLLMNRVPSDYDVATSAQTSEIKACFSRCVPVGEKHGTIAVLTGHRTVEVSTYKGQGRLGAEKRPGIENDLLFRDFTINAMAMDECGKVIDPYGGLEDLRHQMLRAPAGQARDRIVEDPLRMMRAVRFCSTLGFELHPELRQAIAENCGLLAGVAVERIRAELNHILISERPAAGIRFLLQTGLMDYVIPELLPMAGFDQRNIRHDKDVLEHSLAVVEGVPPRLNVRLGALLHDVAKPRTCTVDESGVGHFYSHHLGGREMAKNILNRLKYDKQTIDDVVILVGEHMSRFAKIRDVGLKKLVNRVGEHNLEDLYDLQKADIMGSAPPFDFSGLEWMQSRIKQILYEKPPLSVKDLAINGNDLIELGFTPGPVMGRILNDLLEMVLEDADRNERAFLINKASEYLPSVNHSS